MFFKITRVLLLIATVAVAAIIFFFSSQGGESSNKTSDGIVYRVIHICNSNYDDMDESQKEDIYDKYQFLVRKSAHLSEFALLGFLLCMLFRSYNIRKYGIFAWLVGTVYAGTDEMHQYLRGTRTALFSDVCIDSAGCLCGIVLAFLIILFYEKRIH